MKQTLLLLALAAGMTACQSPNVHNVVKRIAEQPVDTTGYCREHIVMTPFTAVEVNCLADVTYTPCDDSTPPSVSILAPKEKLARYAAHVNNEGTLVLTVNRQPGPADEDVPVVYIQAPAVNAFDINGGKCLRLGPLKLHSPLQLRLNGTGSITAHGLQATSVGVELNGSGNIDLKGLLTDRLKAQLNGNGHIKLAGKAGQVTVNADGQGSIDTSGLKKNE